MSIGSSSLGSVVLVLTTDAQPLRRGLSEAKQLTIQQTAELKRAARIQLEADLLKLRADFKDAQTLARETAQRASRDSRIELAANNTKLAADLRAAERLVRETAQRASRESTFEFRTNLAAYQSDLRKAEQLHAASVRQMERESQQSQQRSGGGGSLVPGFVGGLAAGAVSAGIGLIQQAAGHAQEAFIGYNASIEDTRAKLITFVKTTAGAGTLTNTPASDTVLGQDELVITTSVAQDIRNWGLDIAQPINGLPYRVLLPRGQARGGIASTISPTQKGLANLVVQALPDTSFTPNRLIVVRQVLPLDPEA